MGQCFLIANIDKKEYINPHKFRIWRDSSDTYSAKLRDICNSRMAGVLPFLLSTSSYYDRMGSWAGDRVIVVGDEASIEYAYLYEEIEENWQEISAKVAKDYIDFLQGG